MSERGLVEEQYAALRKQYELPSLNEAERVLDTRITDGPVMRNFLLHILDYYRDVLGHVYGILEPSHSTQSVESEFYTTKQKKDLVKDYNKYMSFSHTILAGIYSCEDEQAKTFKEAYRQVKELKKFSKKLCEFHAKKWLEKPGSKSDQAHFG